MEGEYLPTLMDQNMKANSKIIILKDRVCYSRLMVLNIQVSSGTTYMMA